MLAYPAFALLKENMPEASVVAFIPAYTKEMAEACPWIDEILIDPSPHDDWRSGFALAEHFKKEHFDAVITLYSRARVGMAAACAKIPYRLAPATKLAQVFYNHRLKQRRSRSEKPEHVYNEDLVRFFLEQHKIPLNKNPQPPFLQFNHQETARIKAEFCIIKNINPKHALVFMHSGSGGSANNLSISQYATLAKHIKSTHGHTFVLTAGPGELEQAKMLSKHLFPIPHVIFHSTAGLRSFAEHIQFASLFISGSTGPLHIAGALNVPTAAFYPLRRSATALRWQTLNRPENRLSFSPDEKDHAAPGLNVNLEESADIISERFLMRSI